MKTLTLLKDIFPIILGVLFNSLSFTAANITQENFDTYSLVLFNIAALFSLIIITIISHLPFRYNFSRFALSAFFSIGFILSMHFDAITLFLEKVHPLLGNKPMSASFITIFSIAFLIISHKNFFKKYIILFLSASLLGPLGIISSFYLKSMMNHKLDPDLNISFFTDQQIEANAIYQKIPNFYFILLDGMTSLAFLENKFKAPHTDQFRNLLKSSNYYLAENAWSSYNVTHLTLASIFQLSYLVRPEDPKYHRLNKFYPAIIDARTSGRSLTTLEKVLYSLGYEIYFTGNKWLPCFMTKFPCAEEKIPWHAKFFNNYTLSTYLQSSLLLKVINYFTTSKITREFKEKFDSSYNDSIAKFLKVHPSLLNQQKPVAFFIHNMIPHPPYVTDQCIPIDLDTSKFSTEQLIPMYVESTKCVYKRVEEFIQSIEKNDPNAVVVIQGDHGSGYFSDMFLNAETHDANVERFSIFHSIKAPEACRKFFYPSMGTINGLKLALGCLMNRKVNLEDDYSYAGFHETNLEKFGKIFLIRQNKIPSR